MKQTILILHIALVTAICFAEPQGRYWIEFTPGSQPSVSRETLRAGGKIHHEFKQLNALVASLPSAALGSLKKNPNVSQIEEDPKRFLMVWT